MLKAACRECGKEVWKLDLEPDGRCHHCVIRLPARDKSRDGQGRNEPAAERARQLREMILTTETAGLDVAERLGIVTAECVFGMNVFRDLAASARDIFGGRSDAAQRTLRESRETALNELRVAAHQRGANAVIAVDLDYSEIGSGSTSMVLVVATGTAVRLASPIDQADHP